MSLVKKQLGLGLFTWQLAGSSEWKSEKPLEDQTGNFHCHFHHILIAKASHKSSSGSKDSKIDTIIPSLNGKSGKVTL